MVLENSLSLPVAGAEPSCAEETPTKKRLAMSALNCIADRRFIGSTFGNRFSGLARA